MDDNQERQDFDLTESDEQLSADEETLLNQLGIVGAARRKFLGRSMAALLGTFAFHLLAKEESFATLAASPDAVFAPTPGVENAVKVLLKINGSTQSLEVDSRTALLDALRERLGLTGTKKGCDQGQCGACTAIVDGRRVLSCLTKKAGGKVKGEGGKGEEIPLPHGFKPLDLSMENHKNCTEIACNEVQNVLISSP